MKCANEDGIKMLSSLALLVFCQIWSFSDRFKLMKPMTDGTHDFNTSISTSFQFSLLLELTDIQLNVLWIATIHHQEEEACIFS